MIADDIKARIAKATAKSAPSLLPRQAEYERPAKEQAVPVPDIREVLTDIVDLQKLYVLVGQHLEYGSLEKQYKGYKSDTTARIKGIYGKHKIMGPVLVDGIKTNRYFVYRKTINATKLLKAGVSQKTIDSCTDETPVETLKITVPGQKEEE